MKRLGLALIAVLAFVLGTAYADSTHHPSVCTVDLEVKGMVCGRFCPPKVNKTLAAVKGVKSVKVSYENKAATVTASGALCTAKGAGVLVKALTGAGYTASVKKITEDKSKATAHQ